MIDLTKFETAVLETLLKGDHSALRTLRNQLHAVQVRERTLTGAGFFATLSVASGATPLSPAIDTAVGGAAAEIEGLQRGAGFVVFIRQGLLDTLEGFSFEEPWPAHIGDFRVYLNESPRVIDIPD